MYMHMHVYTYICIYTHVFVIIIQCDGRTGPESPEHVKTLKTPQIQNRLKT